MSETELSEMLLALRGEAKSLYAVLRVLVDSYFLKGAMLVAIAIAVAAGSRERFLEARDYFIIRLSIGAVAAATVGRLLQNVLPHRDRPFVALDPTYKLTSFGAESSFPSDHGIYMGCIAAAIFMKDRTLGTFAFAWTILIILTPRVLMNFHYPTDVIGGAAMGVLIGWAAIRTPMPAFARDAVAAADQRLAPLVYPLGFLFAYSAVTNFEDVRGLLSPILP